MQEGRPFGGEELAHGVVEFGRRVGGEADGAAGAGVLREVRVDQGGVPDGQVSGELLLADLAQGAVVQEDVLDGEPW